MLFIPTSIRIVYIHLTLFHVKRDIPLNISQCVYKTIQCYSLNTMQHGFTSHNSQGTFARLTDLTTPMGTLTLYHSPHIETYMQPVPFYWTFVWWPMTRWPWHAPYFKVIAIVSCEIYYFFKKKWMTRYIVEVVKQKWGSYVWWGNCGNCM